MEALHAIMTRRSIRMFTGEPVSEEDAERLLRAAMAAPSAGNQQAWQFVAVRDRDLLEALATTSPYAGPLRGAKLALVVCGDTARESHPGYWVQDCAAAVQNILLAAHALGLGAVWLGYHPREERVKGAQKVLGLPEKVTPLAVLAIGHPGETKPPSDRYDETRVHRDRW